MRTTLRLKIVSICMTAMLLSACGISGADSACAVFDPIYTDRCNDKFVDKTARQINDHNEKGAKLCGWKEHTGVQCPTNTKPQN